MSEKIKRTPSNVSKQSSSQTSKKASGASSGVLLWVSAVVCVLSVFVLVPIDPEVVTDPHALQRLDNLNESTAPSSTQFTRQDVFFPCGAAETCHGWLYLPSAAKSPSKLILMGCGMGAVKQFGMEKYAVKFASSQFAVFLFDYRGFGVSFGTPRNRIGPFWHLEDWRAAINHLFKSGKYDNVIDVSRIGLWGTSFAGGHVLSLAAELSSNAGVAGVPKVSAVVSQMPFLDGNMASMKNIKERGVPLTLRLVLASVQDHIRSWVGLPPVMIRIVGLKGSLAYMNVPADQLDIYSKRLPSVIIGGWKNIAPARGIVEIRDYSPLKLLKSSPVSAPVLLVGALKDELCPVDWLRFAKENLHGPVKEHAEDCSHFEIYGSPFFDGSSDKMTEFFQEFY